MEKLIVESGIKVTGELGVSLGSLVVVSQVVLGGRETILLLSASTTGLGVD